MSAFHVFVALAALINAAMCSWLGWSYQVIGFGLHPALCVAGAGACLSGAYLVFRNS